MSKSRPAPKNALSSALIKVVESSTKKGDLKKAKIIEASVACLAKHGIEKASFEKIGKEAKMTRAHVNYYFKEKPDLLQATLEFVLVNAQEMTTKKLEKVQKSEDLLKALNEVTFEWVETFPQHVAVLALLNYYCIVDKKFKNFNTTARETARMRLVEILKIHRPEMKLIELKKLAFAVHAIMAGYILESSTTKLLSPISKLKNECYSNIQIMLENA